MYATGMSGVHEIPFALSPATGFVLVNVIPEQDLLEVTGTFEALTSPAVGAHIHWAPVGQPGPVILPLEITTADGRSGHLEASVTMSSIPLPDGVTLEMVLAELAAGNAYVNVHTQAHQTGEIRGQILSYSNRAPGAAEARGPNAVMIAGNPDDRLLSVSWLPVNDPDGDKVNYLYQMSLDPSFQAPELTESFADGNGFRLSVEGAAMLYDSLTGGTPGNIQDTEITIYYRVITTDGWLWTAGPYSALTLTRGSITGSESETEVPAEFALLGNYPNPFNPTTNISFDLPEAAEVSVQVVDMLGRRVATLRTVQMQAGAGQTMPFDAAGLQSGIYLYRVVAKSATNTYVRTGSMTLLK
jgi:hypothetical protein